MLISANDARIYLDNITRLPYYALWIPDTEYYLPTVDQVKDLLKGTQFDTYAWTTQWDCDDFALLLHAFIRQCQYDHSWPYPWLFGEVWGRFKGGAPHAKNFAVLSDNDDKRFVLIEPQTDGLCFDHHAASYSFLRC